MRQQNGIIFSSGKNKRVAHEIARGLDGGVCKVVVWDEFFSATGEQDIPWLFVVRR